MVMHSNGFIVHSLFPAIVMIALLQSCSLGAPSGRKRVLKWMDTDLYSNSSFISMMKIQNMEVKFSCETNMVPKPSITWLKNGKLFNGRAMGKVVIRGYTLKMTGLLAAFDKGNYTCLLNNSIAWMNRTFSLDIIIQHRGPPDFTVVPENRTVLEGDDAELNCRYISGAAAYVQWVKHYTINGSYFSNSGIPYVQVVQSGSSSEIDPGQLIIHNVTLSDSGWYTCIVSNQDGQSVNRSAWLNVTHSKALPPLPLVTGVLFNQSWIIGISAGIALAVIVIVAASAAYIKMRQHRHQIIPWSKNALYGPMPSLEPIDSEWEFCRENLLIGELIGEGNFGRVHKGFATGLCGRAEPVVVAVKMLREDATGLEKGDLLSEIEVMKTIGQHLNIINFLGCCTRNDGPVQVIVEFASHGNLKQYLQKKRRTGGGSEVTQVENPLDEKDLISFSFQVARGMEYLASQKIVHRDLAARNVLVSDDHIMKISDFGLTRYMKEKEYYQRMTNGRLPVKWMAIESLTHNRYTLKSDVWSYGVLLWEIFSYGENPYPSVPVENLLQVLQRGHRMEKPSEASDEIYGLMQRCWLSNPSDRPHFSEIVLCFDEIMTKFLNINYLNLQCVSEADDALEASEEDVTSDTSQESDTLNTASPTEKPVVTSIVNSCIHSVSLSSSSLNLPPCGADCKAKIIPRPTTTLSMGNLVGVTDSSV